jgi:predicted phosphoribosyltransferase
MNSRAGKEPLYPTRSAAGATLGGLIYQRITAPACVWAVAPSGVEIAAAAADGIRCRFDVVVGSHVRIDDDIVGALAEDADAVIDPAFSPKFSMLDAIEEAIDRSRRAIKQERLLFRGQRPLRDVADTTVVILDGHVLNPWKLIAATHVAEAMNAKHIIVAAAAATHAVQERMIARRLDFVCPSILMDPKGHVMPFGDPQDPNAERLRSIVVARQAA